MRLKLERDPHADALYIKLADKPDAFGEDFGDERRVDYAADGTPIGIELLCVSQGVDLTDLPHAERLAGLLKGQGLRVLAHRTSKSRPTTP